MQLNSQNRASLVDEFRSISKQMKDSEYADTKMFYFSGTFGILSRIFNFEFDSQLAFMHLILNNVHANITARIQALKAGDNVVQFPERYFDILLSYVETLANKIERDEEVYNTLENICVLAFLTTGNGFYLYKKGLISIPGLS